MGDELQILLRTLVSLGVVLALLVMFARRAKNGKLPVVGLRRSTGQAHLRVVARQSLGGRSQVALVEVEGRHIVLGVTETQVTMLTEVEPIEPEPGEDTDQDETTTDTPISPAARKPQATSPANPLEGSALSPHTWSQAWDAVRGRTQKS